MRPLFLFFIVFYSSLEGSVFFRLYAKRGSWNRKKGAVENEKIVVHKNIKYSIKIYRTD